MGTKLKKIAIGGTSACVGIGLSLFYFKNKHENSSWLSMSVQAQQYRYKPILHAKRSLPKRAEQIATLETETFDVVIIGGGATGAGCALDAVTRGLKTALVETDDFSAGTSSRSTKLIHGGVRYLQKAILELDREQYRMVEESLHERASMLHSAPHLARPLPIMVPVYQWWQIPYFWFGMKMYDLVAGTKTVKSSYLLSKASALEKFPMLKTEKLCGAIVYFDGQVDDARMNLTIALTATRYGATIANHVTVTSLQKTKENVIWGVNVRDEMTKKEWTIPTKCVINATGPFTDTIRKMDDPKVQNICSPSTGVHIVLPGYYSPDQMGLLDPETADGRVVFFLPWQDHTIAGTTDVPCSVTHHPKPTEEEITFILNEIRNYLNPDVEVRRGDVMSAWSGIRPLVSDPNKPDTQSISRNHIVHVSDSKLVTIAGGKWTTYRLMAEETIDKAIQACGLKPEYSLCQTDGLLMEGAHGWTPTMYIRLVQDFGLESEVARHLSNAYGDRAFAVAKLAKITGKRWPIIGNKLHPEMPYIDAEVRYGIQEYALSAIDLIARRLRMSFLNAQAALEALPVIVDIMAEELTWSDAEKQKQLEAATEFIKTEMGQNVNKESRERRKLNLSDGEIYKYMTRFKLIDKEDKGYISINDIRRSTRQYGEKEVPGEELHEILKEIDTNMNGQVELDEYLQMMSAIKSGHVAYSRFARIVEIEEEAHKREVLKKKITVERSGGGL